MVDRDPVTIATGIEETAPVLNRKIKAELEIWLLSDIAAEEIVPVVERLVDAYLSERNSSKETFSESLNRVGHAPFHHVLYSAIT